MGVQLMIITSSDIWKFSPKWNEPLGTRNLKKFSNLTGGVIP